MLSPKVEPGNDGEESAWYSPPRISLVLLALRLRHLVDLLLLIQRVLPRSRIDEQEETTNNGEDLEEIVLGEVLVWVCVVELSQN